MCKKIKIIKVEADFSADPLWCQKCSTNLDSDDFPLSEALKEELYEWVEAYGTWIDWETDGIHVGGVAMEEAHNARGLALTERVREELSEFEVVFSPSTFAKRQCDIAGGC